MSNALLPDRHRQADFFTCDVFDTFKDDLASMEHPVFSLSKKPDHRMLVYEKNGATIKIKPSYTGLATIFDKDILLYLASSLISAKNNGQMISRAVRFSTYDYIVATNKSLGGMQYKQFQEGLERLKGTVIQTNIETGGVEITEEFGLIDKWKSIRSDSGGKALAVEVVLSEWFYNSILSGAVLSIDRDYFRLRKPIERRLYELARKHCGQQSVWKIKLSNLQSKVGSNSQIKLFRFAVKVIAETNHLPEYNITIDDDVVKFTRKEPPKSSTPELLPAHVNKAYVTKHAKPGESFDQAKARLEKKKTQGSVSVASCYLSKPAKTPSTTEQVLARKKAIQEAKAKLKQ